MKSRSRCITEITFLSFCVVCGGAIFASFLGGGQPKGAMGLSPPCPRAASVVPAWTRTWGSGGDESGEEILLDDAGNVFLGGRNASGGGSAFVVKYDASGTPLWNASKGGTYGGMAFEPGGNLVLAGWNESNMDAKVFVAAYDAGGVKQWDFSWKGGGMSSFVECVAVDPLGNVFVAGANYTTYYDAFLTKFDPSGTELWNISWDRGSWDFFNSLTLDGTGSLYVAGTTGDFSSSARYPSPREVRPEHGRAGVGASAR